LRLRFDPRLPCQISAADQDPVHPASPKESGGEYPIGSVRKDQG
jgi:hypothetical protein